MLVEYDMSEEKLSSLMAERLRRDTMHEPVPENVRTLHEAGFLPNQIAHRLNLSRSDIQQFVKRLTPVEQVRYGT